MIRFVNKRLKALMVGLLLLCAMSSGLTALAADTTLSVFPNYTMKAGEESVAQFLIENTNTGAHTYSFKPSNVPNGMESYFTVNSKPAEELSLQASESAAVQFHLAVPDDVSEKTARIDIEVLRDDGVSTITTLSYTRNTDYSVQLISTIDNLQVVSGGTLSFDIAVTNTGDKDLNALALKVDLPYKWIQNSVSPEMLTLKPGESGSYQLNVSVPVSQSSGSSTIKMTVSNENMSSGELSLPVKVAANSNFVWILGGIALVVAATAFIYFRKHGRR
jgi:uncharacterized membrane protein